jgi:CHAT domain-containing protein/Tfp pilus assembly protein PilF
MTPTPEVQERLRRYLLGQLTDGAREEVEEDLLATAEVFEELLVIEDELVDQYLNESLEAADRTAFENHFLSTPERHDKLRFGRAFDRYLSSQMTAATVRSVASPAASRGWTQTLFSSPLRIGVFAIIVVGIAFGAWRIFIHQSEVDKGLVALNAAYENERPLESRISSLSYAPFSQTRGGPNNQHIDALARDRAELILNTAASDPLNAAAHHALGQVYLAKKDFERAIHEFEIALSRDSKNAKLFSDLGAAWLEKARLDSERKGPGQGAEALNRSFENLTKAIEFNSHLLEARFNRALCFELMMLPVRAEDEWREYLKGDSTSPWAEEAKHKLKELEERNKRQAVSDEELLQDFRAAFENGDDTAGWLIVSQHRDLSGGPIANALINLYLDQAIKGEQAQATETLKVLRYVAKLEQDKAGDLFVRDVVRFLESSSASQRESVVEARRLLKLARDNLKQSKGKAAEEYLSPARTIFEQIGDKAEAAYVDYPTGHSYLMQFDSQRALETFNHVVRQTQNYHYQWLQAQALSATANVQIGLTDLSAALQTSRRSLILSREIGDTTGVMKTTNQLAQQYFRLGNYTKSLELHQESLVMAMRSGTEPIQFWRTYFTMPFTLDAMGLHAAAIEYEKEALRWSADASQPPVTVCRTYSLLGLMYAGQGDFSEALKNSDVAVEQARKISDETSRKEAVAYSFLQRALVHKQAGNFDKAIADYDEAIKLYDQLDKFQAFNYLAQKGRLLSCIHQENCGSVEEKIQACISLFENFRSKILEESNREPFFDTAQDIYDVAIDYELSRHNVQKAFEYAEQARARSLLDLANNTAKSISEPSGRDIRFDASTPVKEFMSIKANLPPEVQVLQYAILKDKVVVWLISNTDFVPIETPVSQTKLNELVFRFLNLVSYPSGDTEALRRDGSWLYDVLIKPIEPSLRKDKLICIIPDKTLNYLPFEALVSSSSGKYLINEFRVMRAPSVNMFIQSSQLAIARGQIENEKLLAVGNPRFNREQFPELADLASADWEAREITHSYERGRPRTLIGTEATKARVVAEMMEANVVHFALHSIVDEQAPLRSRLVLAEGTPGAASEESGVLQAYEINDLKLPVTRLVVLSSCESGVGRYYRGEGIMGLSRMFVAKVPLVVASLWPVDSHPTAALMIAFHRQRTSGKFTTVEALQRAQQEMANGDDVRYRHPYYWAAFTAVGGYTRF